MNHNITLASIIVLRSKQLDYMVGLGQCLSCSFSLQDNKKENVDLPNRQSQENSLKASGDIL